MKNEEHVMVSSMQYGSKKADPQIVLKCHVAAHESRHVSPKQPNHHVCVPFEGLVAFSCGFLEDFDLKVKVFHFNTTT